jgi:hypothetical protein
MGVMGTSAAQAQEVVTDTLQQQPMDAHPLSDSLSSDHSLRIADSVRVADSLRLQEIAQNTARMARQSLSTLSTSWSEWQAQHAGDSIVEEQPKSVSARQRAARLAAQRQAEAAVRIDSMKAAAARQASLPRTSAESLTDFRMPPIASADLSMEPLEQYSEVAVSSPRRATVGEEELSELTSDFSRSTALGKERQQSIDKFFTSNPFKVHYLRGRMLQAPEKEMMRKDHLLKGSQVDVANFEMNFQQPLKGGKPSADKWHYHGYSTYQMTQTAMSDNWYKGGEDNMTIYSDQKLQIKRYDADKITTFESTIQLKLGFYYTQADTIHSMRVNDNQLSIDVKYGYKAWKRWYYSGSMTFKTPIFNYYPSNSHTVKSAFLSPAELNVNLGTDYSYENKKKTVSYSLMLAPLSYYMKYVDNKHVSVTQYGITAGHRTLNQIGSSLTSKLTWKICNSVQWDSRLYMFTSYDSFLGEFENTFTFRVNRYLSANIMLYPRIDDGTAYDPWQMKEMLTFGFNYVWK